MHSRLMLVSFVMLGFTACVAPIKNKKVPTTLSPDFHDKPGRIAVVVTGTRTPKLYKKNLRNNKITELRDNAHKEFRDKARQLRPKGWRGLDKWTIKHLRRNGYKAKRLNAIIDPADYDCGKVEYSPDELPTQKCGKNIGKALKASKELRIRLVDHGLIRDHYSHIPRDYPYAVCRVKISMNDLRSGERLWQKPEINHQVRLDEDLDWDNPPHYPEASIAYLKVTRACAKAVKDTIEANFGEK